MPSSLLQVVNSLFQTCYNNCNLVFPQTKIIICFIAMQSLSYKELIVTTCLQTLCVFTLFVLNRHLQVDLYRQHWWRCNGPCQKRPPYYGMVKRAMNRAPAPRDPWWPDHQRTCGGTYHKIREPEDYGKKKRKKDDGTSAENEATKDTPKIYDLWNKESGGKSHKTNSSDSSTNDKPNYSKTSSGNDINTGDLSTNAGGTKIDNFWRVENDDSSGKENDVQKINHAFTPFTGKGHVLGSVQSETSTNSVKKQGNTRTVSKGRDFSSSVQGNGQDFQGIKSFLQNTGRSSSRSGHLNRIVTSTQSKSSKAIDITENDFVDDADIDIVGNTARSRFIKGNESRSGTKLTTESNSTTLNEIGDVSTDTQQKVNSGTQLTIVDAFKNVGDKKVPLVVINETPTKSAVLASVQCPICLLKVEETQINAHLDACLS